MERYAAADTRADEINPEILSLILPSPVPTDEQRLRFLADAMPQIVWTARPDGGLDYFNHRWYEYTGLTFEQTRDWAWQSVLHPDDIANCLELWRRSVQTGEPYEVEYRFRRSFDGAYRWHLGRGLPMRNAEGKIALWVGTCTDIDDQKRIEAALRESEAREHAFLRDVLRAVTENKLHLCGARADLPPPFPDTEEPAVFPLTTPTLSRFRAHVHSVALDCGFDEERRHDLITAAGEASMNAVVHGGSGTGRVYTDPTHGRVQIWVEDAGQGIALTNLHRATLERGYTTAGSMGYGFYLMLKTADRIYLLTGPTGTTVVIEQERTAVDPLWTSALLSLGEAG